MIEETLSKIENRLKNCGNIQDAQRTELLGLMGELRSEVLGLSEADPDHARSIASYAELSTHEATRGELKPVLLEHALGGLSKSVLGFESAHPKLTEVVNRISVLLSNMGV